MGECTNLTYFLKIGIIFIYKIIKHMRNIDLKNVVWKEGKYYVAWNLNTAVSSFGDTKKEALNSLEEALELYFEDVPIAKINKVERPDLVPLKFKYA